MTEGRVVEIRMPISVEVHIFASEEHPGCDIVLLSAKCIDVVDGKIGGFMSRTRVTAGDCSQHDILDHVVDWLRHEVAEQLGMDPHKNDVRDQLARDVQVSRDRNADEIDAAHKRLSAGGIPDNTERGPLTLRQRVDMLACGYVVQEREVLRLRQRVQVLERMLRTSTVRIEILMGRMRACNETPQKHDLSLKEGAAWVDEERAILGSAE